MTTVIKARELNSKVMSKAMVKRYIKKLHLGSSPGIDGIVSEHLKYAINSGIVRHLSVMLSLATIKFKKST